MPVCKKVLSSQKWSPCPPYLISTIHCERLHSAMYKTSPLPEKANSSRSQRHYHIPIIAYTSRRKTLLVRALFIYSRKSQYWINIESVYMIVSKQHGFDYCYLFPSSLSVLLVVFAQWSGRVGRSPRMNIWIKCCYLTLLIKTCNSITKYCPD